MTANVILNKGNANQLTVHTNQVELAYLKKLIIIDPPNPKDKAEDGPKETIIVDRQRRILRITIRGYIAATDETKITQSYEIGTSDKRTINVEVNGTAYVANIEKMTLTWGGKSGEQSEIQVFLTLLIGEGK